MNKWRCIALSLVVNALMWGFPTDSVLADTSVNDVSDSHETLMYDPAARLMGMDGVVSDVSSLDVLDVPETKEPEAEVFVEPENYDVSTMKLKTSELGVSEDGGAVDNELFEFEAFIKESDIKDGTAPFDSNDEAGNDSGNKNGIVRTFDSITYPIKITINPKKVDKLNNIVLKITGTLENGVTDGRVNARFAIGGYENLETKVVGFEQIYTVEQTGNSVMIPVAIEVQGAENGIDLKPNLKVQVISVEGKDISTENIATTFENLPSVTTSAKVSIKALWNYSGFSGAQQYKAIMDSDSDDWLYKRGVSFGVKNLNGKSDNRGATFPVGKIKFEVKIDGQVVWDQSKNETLKFGSKDTPVTLFDHYPEMEVKNLTGSENTEMEGISYYLTTRMANNLAKSEILNHNIPTNVQKNSFNSVWDSGEYEVGKTTSSEKEIQFSGSFEDYVVGSTFPLYRSDGWSGYTLYGVNDKIFSTHVFHFRTPNDYKAGGINNQRNESNNVYYNIKLNVLSYEDSDGVEHKLDSVKANTTIYERNTVKGSINVNNTFYTVNGRDLGSTVNGDGYISTGDPAVVLGEDVKFYSYVNSHMVYQGGMKVLYRWNTDSFELTKKYAEETKNRIYYNGYKNETSTAWIRNNYDKHKVSFGVPKSHDNSFQKLTKYTKDDYDWFETYEEAVKIGAIGAIQSDMQDVTGNAVNYNQISLHVKTKNIGSKNENGTENIALTTVYIYPDEERKTEYVLDSGRAFNSSTQYNEIGEIVKNQSPVGHGINFETLGVLNAETSSKITSDKATYYNSESVEWTIQSSILLHKGSDISDFDRSVQVKQILPKGLDYVVDSGKQGVIQKDPKIEKNDDGSTALTWDILISGKDTKIDDIKFTTTINPFALTSGIQSSLTVKNIISSELDTRAEKLRTTSRTINILKVGMVGIFENIDVDNGERNSSFTVRMKPYTTIEDELDVKGLTVIPLSGDKLGSMYQGAAVLSSIDVTSTKPVSIYLNNSIVESNKPNQIDFTKNGWYKYTGKDQDISKALSLLFHVEGELSSADDIGVSFTVSTKDNNFGNIYYNETVINSATDYNLSPISNKVRYTIRADVELNLERLQIYTAKASEKLPVNLRVNKDIIKDRSLNEPLKLVLYDKEKNTKVYEKSLTIATLTRENELEVPAKYLEKNTNRTYEARIEGYNTDRIYVKKEADKIEALGYTAMEGTIERDAATSDKLEFKGVLMAERELGKELSVYYEQFIMPLKKLSPVKAGYGFALDQTLTYTNDLSINNVSVPAFYTVVDSNVLDGRIASAEGDTVVDLTSYPTYNGNTLTQSVSLPPVYVSQLDGAIFSEAEYNEAVTSTGAVGLIDGGNKLYTPIWISRLGSYDYAIKSKDPIGVNAVNIVVKDVVSVEAFMYDHIGSESAGKDELLIVPVIQDGEISGFDDLSDVERDWLNH